MPFDGSNSGKVVPGLSFGLVLRFDSNVGLERSSLWVGIGDVRRWKIYLGLSLLKTPRNVFVFCSHYPLGNFYWIGVTRKKKWLLPWVSLLVHGSSLVRRARFLDSDVLSFGDLSPFK